MTEFRQKIETSESTETLLPPETPVVHSENPNGESLKDAESPEASELEVWETENRRKYSVDYFDAKALSADFNTKMLLSKVDKFVKGELAEKGFKATTENYKSILAEIEAYLGSSRMELYQRMSKIIGYVDVISRERKIKKLKESYGINH